MFGKVDPWILGHWNGKFSVGKYCENISKVSIAPDEPFHLKSGANIELHEIRRSMDFEAPKLRKVSSGITKTLIKRVPGGGISLFSRQSLKASHTQKYKRGLGTDELAQL